MYRIVYYLEMTMIPPFLFDNTLNILFVSLENKSSYLQCGTKYIDDVRTVIGGDISLNQV